ncbi:alkaline phosphatase family protein [Acidobacteria bacterium AH-259-L09]|nr:alkaline phosphatase family protein [Acidobacteria bacterium AH-259-L09]
MDKGVMPNLRYLCRFGARGELDSVHPPITAPAWSSFRTGVNPGKHGIYGFTRLLGPENDDSTIQIGLNNASQIRTLRLWDYLGRAGLRVGVFNLPFTYPVDELNGTMIAASMTGGERLAGYPENIIEEVLRKTGTHFFEKPIEDGVSATQAYILRLIRAVEEQLKVDLWSLANLNDDVYITVYTETDPLQHMFYKYLDPAHPEYESPRAARFRPLLTRFYRALDDAVGRMLEACDSRTTVLVLSDHGFQSGDKIFNINSYLLNKGFLSLKDDSLPSRTGRAINWGSLLRWLARADILNLRSRMSYDLKNRILSKVTKINRSAISSKESLAFMASNNEMSIHLNKRLSESERRCTAEELCTVLRDLKDPDTSLSIFRGVYSREDVYEGPFTEFAADILLLPNPPYQLRTAIGAQRLIELQNPFGQCGDHAREGMLIAFGPSVQNGLTLGSASIMDITPTVLQMLGLPIPEAMDGNVLGFSHTRASEDPLREKIDIYTAPAEGEREVYSEHEEQVVRDRLRNLGYIDRSQ